MKYDVRACINRLRVRREMLLRSSLTCEERDEIFYAEMFGLFRRSCGFVMGCAFLGDGHFLSFVMEGKKGKEIVKSKSSKKLYNRLFDSVIKFRIRTFLLMKIFLTLNS